MLRTSWVCRKKVPYASLFSFNPILQSVFESKGDRVAIRVQTPGKRPECFTYGRLQRDVIALCSSIAKDKEHFALHSGKASLSWAQKPKSAQVCSFYSHKDGIPSCDILEDSGIYNSAILCGSGYVYAVSLLSCWALNQMAIPMSISQRYEGELSYVLEHSGCTQVLTEKTLFSAKFPSHFHPLVEPPLHVEAPRNSEIAKDCNELYRVQRVFDVQSLFAEFESNRSSAQDTPLSPEWLEPKVDNKKISSADDVVERLEREREEAAFRHQKQALRAMWDETSARTTCTSSDNNEPLTFDDEKLEALNPLHRYWIENPSIRPTIHDDCIIIYTSGTTARPKGAVHTHASIANMVSVLQDVWHWSLTDTILNVLPLHHIHGIVNILLCSLASNAQYVCTPFDSPVRVARRLMEGDITLFMAVPTVYTRLIAALRSDFSPIEQTAFKKILTDQVRLMISGSAALPPSTLQQFYDLSGHTLLERYGMTEVGMALSQPLRPLTGRKPGTVGSPLPTVDTFVRCAEPSNEDSQQDGKNKPVNRNTFDLMGHLAIASPSLLDRYWANPQATKKEAVTDEQGRRYFDTGDFVGVHYEQNASHLTKGSVFTILGRSSVDIIKCKGYKISALEVESALLTKKDLYYEVAVVGVRDDILGEMIVAVASLHPAAIKELNIQMEESCFESPELNRHFKVISASLMSPYKCPDRYLLLKEIPRNPTGKVNKKALKKLLNLE